MEWLTDFDKSLFDDEGLKSQYNLRNIWHEFRSLEDIWTIHIPPDMEALLEL